MALNTVRGLVSKKKKRFQQDGFDLDLAYCTTKIIAMGFPSEGIEAAYRNPMPEVQRFFNSRHPGHHKIYNLCSERAYDLRGKFEEVEHFPFDDHNPCSLSVLKAFCQSVEAYLSEHEDNVVGIHCKAGKGRTGLCVSALLLHSGICRSAGEALALFAQQRTHNRKGVTIPSQARYVFYYERLLREPEIVMHTYHITHIRMVTVPTFDSMLSGGGCDPYFVCKVLDPVADGETCNCWRERTIFNQSKAQRKLGMPLRHFYPQDRVVDFDLTQFNVKVRGDVKLMFYDEDRLNKDDKMCSVWFHTAFVERNFLVFHREVVDGACKDKSCKHFDSEFQLQVFLHRVDDADFTYGDVEDDESEDQRVETQAEETDDEDLES